ncbi:hypothetical protein [Streptosporangium sp. NBC_01756]|uniref:hypothetical protein n=1 Tax=Streptosporangium sp. NBC_01756 TaxID=2975950 RepID=UPI002DDC180C|nr:hypothetical protein [Streptosporangium sp. NBC_01756]WSC89680.1 hypothetical protein OIE48_16310 [Streptosporangium sp. NBC_01756]
MRWPIAAFAVVLASALVVGLGDGASAQTVPADPVDALRSQMAGNGGVRFVKTAVDTLEDRSDVPSWMTKDKHKITFRGNGTVQFGGGKVTATDVTSRNSHVGPDKPLRFVTFEGRSYMSGWLTRPLPAGKEWVLSEDDKTWPEMDIGRIRLADPATLRAVLATTTARRPGGVYDGTRTTLYEGKVTFGELSRAYPGFRLISDGKPTAKDLKIEVSWRLWIGEDQLVRRAWSSWTEPFLKVINEYVSTVTDVRLTGWGAATRVLPPSDEQVVKASGPAPDFTVHTLRRMSEGLRSQDHPAFR